MFLRQFHESDTDELVQLLLTVREASPVAWPTSLQSPDPESARRWMFEGRFWYRLVVAANGGRLLGHGVVAQPVKQTSDVLTELGSSRPLLELRKGFVDPAYRGRGIGSMLLDARLGAAIAVGGLPVMSVREDNATMRRLAARRGFLEAGSYVTVRGIPILALVYGPQLDTELPVGAPPAMQEVHEPQLL